MNEKKQNCVIMFVLSLLFFAILLMIISISYLKVHKSPKNIFNPSMSFLSSMPVKSEVIAINLSNKLGKQHVFKNAQPNNFKKALGSFQKLKPLPSANPCPRTNCFSVKLQMEFSNKKVKTLYSVKHPVLKSKYYLKVSDDKRTYIISEHDFISIFYNI